MAFSNTTGLDLGNLLQIVFSDGYRTQISEDYRDWEYITRYRYGNSAARELRFLFQTDFGPSAIQYRNPGTSGRTFPTSDQSGISENTAQFKEINATIQLEYNLWDRARKSPEKYAEPLALEIQSKTTAAKRRIAADLYGDGSGVMGEIEGAGTIDSDDRLVAVLSTDNDAFGHIGFFEFKDKLTPRNQDGTVAAPGVSSGTFNHYTVEVKNRNSNSVTLTARDSSGTKLTVTSTGLTDGDVFYRGTGTTASSGDDGQPTIPDLTAITSSTDRGTLTEVIAGLESLTQDDSRTIHGITMAGATAGTREDASGNPIDVKFIQNALDQVKVNAGQGAYNWKMMTMSPETHAALIESRESDRRFHTVEDNKRGTTKFVYMHNDDAVETYTTEYCPQKRIYMLPESKGEKKKVLEYWGSDFEPVRAQGMNEFHLNPGSSGGYTNDIVSFLQSIGVIICKHPAAIAVVENFTNS